MKWENYLQIVCAFVALVLSIAFLSWFHIDINFIVTLILAIFTLTISIFFFIESNRTLQELKSKVISVGENVRRAMDGTNPSLKSLYISDDLTNGNVIGNVIRKKIKSRGKK